MDGDERTGENLPGRTSESGQKMDVSACPKTGRISDRKNILQHVQNQLWTRVRIRAENGRDYMSKNEPYFRPEKWPSVRPESALDARPNSDRKRTWLHVPQWAAFSTGRMPSNTSV